jgi:hypothetical protein
MYNLYSFFNNIYILLHTLHVHTVLSYIYLTTMLLLYRWLCHDGPSADKHNNRWSHPFVAVLLHYVVVVIVSCSMHDLLFLYGSGWRYEEEMDTEECNSNRHDANGQFRTTNNNVAAAAAVCSWYFVIMQAFRLYSLEHKQAVLYEMTWLCNVTLVMGPIGLYWNRPIIASAHCIAVGIDQLLWYVDLLGYALR